MSDKIVFLGTGDAMGVPRLYCECLVCREAREHGNNQRLRSSLMFCAGEDRLLLDCGPDFKEQMEGLKQRELKHALITHAHYDHVAGLPEWADACRWLKTRGNVYAPMEVIDTLKTQYPWLQRNFDYHSNDN